MGKDNKLKSRIGEEFTTYKGYEIIIIEYYNNKNCSVQFKKEGYIIKNISYGQIKEGYIKIPNDIKVGEKFITNEGYEIEIIEYIDETNCTIRFKNGNVIKNRYYTDIKKGCIKNPLHKSIFGVGFLGQGKYSAKRGNKIYTTWRNMLRRCYDKTYQEVQPTYKDVTVCEEWKCFQIFAEWVEENYKEGFQLDKDILIKGNKIYSPETCCFVPQEINNLFTKRSNHRGEYPIGVQKVCNNFQVRFVKSGVQICLGVFNTIFEAFQAYKTAKEAHIKEVADKWRGQITEPCYEALINYQVEITD